MVVVMVLPCPQSFPAGPPSVCSPLLPSCWNNEAKSLLLSPPPFSLPSSDNQLSLECLVFSPLPSCSEGKEGRELAFRSLKLQASHELEVGALGPDFKGICLAMLVVYSLVQGSPSRQPCHLLWGLALLHPNRAFTSLGHIILTCNLRITDCCRDKCSCLGEYQMVP